MRLRAVGGDLSPETLQWLEGLPADLKVRPGAADALRVMFDRLEVRCSVQAGRGQFEGPMDLRGMVPLMTERVLAVDVPILGATGRPFDAAALWAAIARGLAGDESGGDGK